VEINGFCLLIFLNAFTDVYISKSYLVWYVFETDLCVLAVGLPTGVLFVELQDRVLHLQHHVALRLLLHSRRRRVLLCGMNKVISCHARGILPLGCIIFSLFRFSNIPLYLHTARLASVTRHVPIFRI
jgi:hypothetical protein